jgi:hypothetical protein
LALDDNHKRKNIMNQEQYIDGIKSLSTNSKLSTIEKLLNYCGYSILPCPDFSIKDKSNITLYSYAGKFISFEPLYIVANGKLGIIELLKSNCKVDNLRKFGD